MGRKKKRPATGPIASPVKRYRTYRRWRRWLAQIEADVTRLAVDRHIYREVGAIVQANPRLQVPSSFFDWIRRSYIETMTLGIRRLVDWDRRTISLVRLIEEIADHPEVLTRRRFVRMYRPSLREMAHRDFERFAAVGAAEVSRAVFRKHRKRLVGAQRRLRRFVNSHVAHRAVHPIRRPPTYADLDSCVDLLEELLKEYALLLTGAGLAQVLPTWQYDWKAPFRVQWIP